MFNALTGESNTIAYVGGFKIIEELKFNWYKSKVKKLYHVEYWGKSDEPEYNNSKNCYNFTSRKEAEKYLCSIL